MTDETFPLERRADVVPIDAYRQSRATLEREQERIDQATRDLAAMVRITQILIRSVRERLDLAPL